MSEVANERAAAALDRAGDLLTAYIARIDADLAEVSQGLEFQRHCLEDLADASRLISEWPVRDGRCRHDRCDMLLTGSAEQHIRAYHWADYLAMRKPFAPPGWHETSPGHWMPDAEESSP